MLIDGPELELVLERIFCFYGARFQIEFAFRDAKQHLGLNDGQVRLQAKLHFHFNIVFDSLFLVRLLAERPLGHGPTRCQIQDRLQPHPAGIPVVARTPSRSGSGRSLNTVSGPAHRLRPQNVSKP